MNVEAVSTTGIYCRPTCSASPLEANVATLASPVAAEAAGYRPCLRCRPDRHLLTAEAGAGAPPAALAALALVSDGYLDRHDEAGLARRVGYSTRQLRRHFERYVGATPTFVARSRRAHFARRLLDETDLSLAQISRLSGFAGPRQLRRDVGRIFGFSPSELRRRRRRGSVLPADGGVRLRVTGPERFDPTLVRAHLGPRVTDEVEMVDRSLYRRVLETCGNDGLIEVDFSDGAALVLTAHLPTFGSLIDDVARVRNLFGLNRDWGSARAALQDDQVLGREVQRSSGISVFGCWDRFEMAVRIIIGQQVTVTGASTVTARLATRRGRPLTDPIGQDDWTLRRHFPTADRLVDLDTHKDGENLGMPNRRVQSIAALARSVCDSSVDLGAPIDEVRAGLNEISGIGPWTVEMIALRALGDPDAFPASDLGIRRAITTLCDLDELASIEQVKEIAERWRGFRSYAAQLLWSQDGHRDPTGSAEPVPTKTKWR